MRVIGVPKTIDNDLDKTVQTFGFDTAVGFASECIDRLFSTATSHGRVIVVEVMGRYAGWIALQSGIASGAHAILIPEIPFRLEPVAATIAQREERGAKFSIVVVAEGAVPEGGHVSTLGKAVDQDEKLGGMGAKVAAGLEELTGKEARTVVLGHLLRGGSPTAFDRVLGLRFGAAAVRGLAAGYDGRDGVAQPADGRLRAPVRGDATDEVRPARLRLDAHRPRTRRQLRRRDALTFRPTTGGCRSSSMSRASPGAEESLLVDRRSRSTSGGGLRREALPPTPPAEDRAQLRQPAVGGVAVACSTIRRQPEPSDSGTFAGSRARAWVRPRKTVSPALVAIARSWSNQCRRRAASSARNAATTPPRQATERSK